VSGAQDSFHLDRAAVARAFDRAGPSYDRAARLQALVRDELLARLEFFRVTPALIVDLGCGTGVASAALKNRYPRAQLVALDLAAGMLRAAKAQSRWRRRFDRMQADARALPLRSQSVDLLFSSLMLQWCDEPDAVFAEWQRVVKPGGLVMFSTFGPETLRELRGAWSQVDGAPHVSLFPDAPSLGSGLMQAGLAEPVMDVEQHRLWYPEPRALMRELREIGASNAACERSRGLTTPRRMARMVANYETLRTPEGVPASYEVLYGVAFGAGPRPGHDQNHDHSHGHDGETFVPVSSLKRRTR
jgi:malonyl-CoA O-methyltransferase